MSSHHVQSISQVSSLTGTVPVESSQLLPLHSSIHIRQLDQTSSVPDHSYIWHTRNTSTYACVQKQGREHSRGQVMSPSPASGYGPAGLWLVLEAGNRTARGLPLPVWCGAMANTSKARHGLTEQQNLPTLLHDVSSKAAVHVRVLRVGSWGRMIRSIRSLFFGTESFCTVVIVIIIGACFLCCHVRKGLPLSTNR